MSDPEPTINAAQHLAIDNYALKQDGRVYGWYLTADDDGPVAVSLVAPGTTIDDIPEEQSGGVKIQLQTIAPPEAQAAPPQYVLIDNWGGLINDVTIYRTQADAMAALEARYGPGPEHEELDLESDDAQIWAVDGTSSDVVYSAAREAEDYLNNLHADHAPQP